MTSRICRLCLLVTILVAAGCTGSGSSGSRTASVTVTNNSGSRLQGVIVVLGDSNGAMKNSGSTDANGAITFSDAPYHATVTAALSCMYSGATSTTYSLDIRYDVDGPVTLLLNDCSVPPGNPPAPVDDALGTITVNVTNSIAGVTQNEMSTNRSLYMYPPGLITQQTVTIYNYDLQQDGKLSFYVIGKDANGALLGYGMLLDQTFTDGMTVNIAVDKPMGIVQYHLTNLPVDVNYLCADISQVRTGKGSVWVDNCRSLSSSSTTTTISVPYIPGLGDQFSYSVDAFVDQMSDSAAILSSQYLSIGPSASLSDQNIDFSQALAAPSLSVAGAATATPTLIWTALDPGADYYLLYARFELASGSFWYLNINELSPTRSSLTFPELPDSLAAFRPTVMNYFSISTYAWSDGLFISSSGSYFNWLVYATKPNKVALPDLQHLKIQRQLQSQRQSAMDLLKNAQVLEQ